MPTSGGVGDEPSAAHRRLLSRRTVLRAGWTVPVVLTLKAPAAFAQEASTRPHGDSQTPHADDPGAHTDTPATEHVDFGGHEDVPRVDVHQDVPGPLHADAHTDVVHGDATAAHTDTPGTSHQDSSTHGDSGGQHSDA